ncbi:MAG: AarF/ABC1/UbiB kinase family protein, partial [Alphaproteobacteria bacterium]|nr:AarF/ABC1/UbiB kinase family protein [Alphaproteobacteria bacterium]
MSDGAKRKEPERNTLARRLKRYANVTTSVGGAAARIAGSRALRIGSDEKAQAADLKAALGGVKGPIMKVAQLLASIPEALPANFAAELATLQTNA